MIESSKKPFFKDWTCKEKLGRKLCESGVNISFFSLLDSFFEV